MKIKTRIAAIAAGIGLALCGSVSKAYATHNCRCGWAYGGQSPVAPNIWFVAPANNPDPCARQADCTGLCNQPDDVAKSQTMGAAAVASYCSAQNLTSGQLVNVYFKTQAGDVVGPGPTLAGCTGWKDADQTYSANCPGGPPGASLSNPDTAIDTTTAANLANLRNQIRPWAITCPGDGTLTDYPMLSDPANHCIKDFDDMTLFSGLSCASGELSRCMEVKKSQGSNGRWWRNPKNVDVPRTFAFSRDATIGLLDYFLTLHETNPVAAKQQAGAWLTWVQNNGNVICPTPPISSAGVDDRCLLEFPDLGLWALVGEVMEATGVQPQLPNQATMLAARATQLAILDADAIGNASGGYTLHLVGLQVMELNRLRREYGRMSLPDPSSIAKRIASDQPNNPFFAYLYHGRSEYVAQKVLSECPAIMPPAAAPPGGGTPYDWAWQRADANHTWNKSMGWDCIFMVNLLLGPGPVVPPTCTAPQTLVNGVCQCPSGTTPSGTNLAGSEACLCPNGLTFVAGACTNTTCPAGQSWNLTQGGVGICCPVGTFDPHNGGQCATTCPSNVVYNRRGSFCCAVGQIIDANGNCAACPNNQVSTGVGACGCANNLILQSNGTCACPANSSLNAAGSCACNIGNQTIVGGMCVCPVNEAVIGGTCAHCPMNEVIVAGNCVCQSPNVWTGSQCVPGTGTGH